jgi:hypothetical protein
VKPNKSNPPSGTLQICVLSSFTVSFSLPYPDLIWQDDVLKIPRLQAFRTLPVSMPVPSWCAHYLAMPKQPQLGHRIAVGHFEHENDIILTSRHIAADQPTAQSRDLGLEVFVLRCHTFDRFRANSGSR